MSRWFEHEDELKPGEKDSEPILGKRFSPFWFFGMGFLLLFILMVGYMAVQFIVSAAATH